MTIDERIEALALHLEVLTRVHEDFEKSMTAFTVEVRGAITEIRGAVTDLKGAVTDIRDVMRRLGNIAAAHSIILDDHEQRIEKLEDKP